MNDLVFQEKSELWTTSNLIAEKFEKAHKHVLHKMDILLENLMAENLTVKHPEKFIEENFENGRNREYRRYKLNKPAFTLLLMQFSGKKVIKAQRVFNQAFYEMEQHILKMSNQEFLTARNQGKIARKQVTSAIQKLVDYATNQGSKGAKFYYSTLTTETYKALGYLAKSEKVKTNFRDYLDSFQLAELFIAETIAQRAIEAGIEERLHYKQIYYNAKQEVIKFGDSQQRFKLTA